MEDKRTTLKSFCPAYSGLKCIDNSTTVKMLKQHTVDLRRLKSFAAEALPLQSVLQGLLLEERDQIPTVEFLVKMDLWLKLLRRTDQGRD